MGITQKYTYAYYSVQQNIGIYIGKEHNFTRATVRNTVNDLTEYKHK